MKATPRVEHILGRLSDRGRVEVRALAAELAVSEMTVRRDLEALEAQGLCRRVHGGAVAAPSRSYEPPFALRAERDRDAKARIGKAAAELVDTGETLFLDVGTTTLAVAEALRGREGITVLTPSLKVAAALADEPHVRVLVPGGTIRPGEHSMVGSLAERGVGEFHVDSAVLGVGGFDPAAGLSEFNLEDAAVKRAAIGRARRVVVVATADKLGVVAFCAIAPPDAVDLLVTDADAADPRVRALADAGVSVRTV